MKKDMIFEIEGIKYRVSHEVKDLSIEEIQSLLDKALKEVGAKKEDLDKIEDGKDIAIISECYGTFAIQKKKDAFEIITFIEPRLTFFK